MQRLKETGILIPTYNAMSCDTFPELIKLLSAAHNDLGKILIIDSSSNDSNEGYSFINTIEKSYSKEDFEIALTIVFIVLIIMSVISLLAVLFVRSKKR